MTLEGECLGCGVDFDYGDGCCPACGWEPSDFADRGRYGLAKPGHGEPEDDGSDGPGGPPPGPGGLLGL
ncbi:MAG: hypothetical protein ABEI80_00345 [Haloplanus sp.]